MNNFVTVGIGGGLVSALLIAVVVKATPLAVFLYLLAPIPILIAAIGWDQRAGLVATATGSAAIALAFSPFSGLGFAVTTALPAWWLAYLALLGRTLPDGTVEWYPLGRVLAWTALTATLTLLAAAILSTGGDYGAFRDNARGIARAILRVGADAVPPAGDGSNLREKVADASATLVPAFAAQGFTIVLSFYLWAAAKVVQVSGRLVRPWPFVPGLAMPRLTLAALAGSVLLGFVGNFVGVFGVALAGALVAAFALQGLAVVHDRSRGKSGRMGLLIGTYLLVVVSQGAALVALTLFGLADTAFGLRRRAPGSLGPGPGPS